MVKVWEEKLQISDLLNNKNLYFLRLKKEDNFKKTIPCTHKSR